MAAVTQTPHVRETILNYYSQIGDEAPYAYVQDPPEGKLRSNIGSDPHPIAINDVRGKEDTVSLDKTGFQYVKHVSEEKDFLDEENITTTYYKEVEELLKNVTGGKRVFIFDHTVRRSPDFEASGRRDPKARGPANRVHIDQTPKASVNRVYRHLGEDADRLLKSRVRLINVWRPIANPVAHHPLAVADWRSVNANEDLVVNRLIYPHFEGETYSVKHNPEHKWYFLSDQTPEEVLLIKCFDSDSDRAMLTPHTAFLDKTSPKDAPHRQSIEVRCLVFDAE